MSLAVAEGLITSTISKVGGSPDPLGGDMCVCVGGCSLVPWGTGIIGTNPPQGPNLSSPQTKCPALAIFNFKAQSIS